MMGIALADAPRMPIPLRRLWSDLDPRRLLVTLTLLQVGLVGLALLVIRPLSEPVAWALCILGGGVGLAVAWRHELARRRVLQEERLRAMAALASGIAHDIHLAAHDTAGVIRRLRELYGEQRRGLDPGPVDLGACIADVVALTRPHWYDEALRRGARILVETDVRGTPMIHGEVPAIHHMLANLVTNAVEAMPEGGTLRLRARAELAAVRLEVSDTGIGMTPDVLERCLDPLFSTKGRRGTGLGLCLVQVTVARHGGTLTVRSEPGRGTTVVVRLPRQPRGDRHAVVSARPARA
jgi:signal transduction histidine kinase